MEVTEQEENDFYADMTLRKDNVRMCVDVAFANTLYPGDNAIFESGDVSLDGIHVFVGKNWRDITRDLILIGYTAQWFLGRIAYQYFLPAFIIGGLNDEITGSIARTFIPPSCPESPSAWNEFNNRFAGLSPEQYQCIRLFLDYVFHIWADIFSEETFSCLAAYWENPFFRQH